MREVLLRHAPSLRPAFADVRNMLLPLDQTDRAEPWHGVSECPGLSTSCWSRSWTRFARSTKSRKVDRNFVRARPAGQPADHPPDPTLVPHRRSAPALARAARRCRARRAAAAACVLRCRRRADGRSATDAQLEQLASFVRGASSRDDAAVTVQEIVGRAFFPGYEADQASWKASELIDRFRDGFSMREIFWRVTGRLRRSRQLLLDRAQQDRMGDAWQRHRHARDRGRAGKDARPARTSRTRHRSARMPCWRGA